MDVTRHWTDFSASKLIDNMTLIISTRFINAVILTIQSSTLLKLLSSLLYCNLYFAFYITTVYSFFMFCRHFSFCFFFKQLQSAFLQNLNIFNLFLFLSFIFLSIFIFIFYFCVVFHLSSSMFSFIFLYLFFSIERSSISCQCPFSPDYFVFID